MQKQIRNLIVALGLLSSLLLIGCGPQNAALIGQQNGSPSPSAPEKPQPPVDSNPSNNDSVDQAILRQYAHFDPNHLIDTKLLEQATLYFHNHKNLFQNQNALTIIDYSLHSSKKRFFIINTTTGDVWSTYVAHGKGSDPGTLDQSSGFAKFFSNLAGSNMTSLGPYKTTETAQSPTHGYVLHLAGLASTNSNAASRAIEVHGADYVHDEAVKQGRSEGCPALPMAYYVKVINIIKGGSLIYAGTSSSVPTLANN